MAHFDHADLKDLYSESKSEAKVWREDYPAYERLADNDLMEGLDENLPEVNDGSLAASLFKLPKRIVSSKLSGTVKALDRDEAWMSELANLEWRNVIIPNANSQAPFHRKWKDGVRKAAIYGSVPFITLFIERNGKRYTDFIVAQPQDVTLEPGKVSDYDSDVIFWDVYFTKLQLENMIEQAKAENEADKKAKDGWAQRKAAAESLLQVDPEAPAFKEEEPQSYNKWNIPALEKILKSKEETKRDGQDVPKPEQGKVVSKGGYKFCIAFQRGVEAPFYMYHAGDDVVVREWSNPDPTGDIPVHFLYCYQDFINPYGIGIVKLAGGTQNVLDYMRQADVLATQLGIRPPRLIKGNAENVDLESMVYTQDADWFVGDAEVERLEMSTQVYEQLPARMSMYKTSLNQLIPTGDTSIQAGSGDPQYSKTPAGVKFQAANLSIDDEDFKDNLYITYAAVAKSMINTHFANMEGTDLRKLSDEEREILSKAGLEFPKGDDGQAGNELEVVWDTARASFDFEVDPEQDKAKADEQKLEGLTKVADFLSNPNTVNLIGAGKPIPLGKKQLDPGELVAEIVSLSTNNDKIMTDATPEETVDENGNPIQTGEAAAAQAQAQQQALADAQKQIETLTEQLRVAKALPYDKAPETVKEQMEQEAGYDRQGVLSPAGEAAVQKQEEIEQKKDDQEHAQSMDLVRTASEPNPLEMAKAKAAAPKPKAKVAA